MAVTNKTKLILAMQSGGICAFPDCRIRLAESGIIDNPALIGEAAHIYGQKLGAARYAEGMTDEQRDHCDNLIYLCPTCHTCIDKQENDYSAEKLVRIKSDHIAWIKKNLEIGMSSISFSELDTASKAIASGINISSINTNFHVLAPEQKIQKNNLSCVSKSMLVMGLSRGHEVSVYLAQMAQIDPYFPERLKNGFREEYVKLNMQFSGDHLFDAMVKFTQTGAQNFTQQAAGLAILSHLFELCEVFEK